MLPSTRFIQALQWAALTLLGVATLSCSHLVTPIVNRQMDLAAKDQIMLVRREPASFGYRRLEAHLRSHPELHHFIAQHGLPDFLAETGTSDRNYFILYNLRTRQAFISRRSDQSRVLEFSGPYPITAKEFRTLDRFRRNSRR